MIKRCVSGGGSRTVMKKATKKMRVVGWMLGRSKWVDQEGS